jgi:hypothetical protein
MIIMNKNLYYWIHHNRFAIEMMQLPSTGKDIPIEPSQEPILLDVLDEFGFAYELIAKDSGILYYSVARTQKALNERESMR